jgi:Secretion system C-terminal sorting domain
MKRIFLLSMFALILSVTLFAQNVPNGGFESWTNGNPNGWFADNGAPIVIPVTQSTTAHSGSFSVKGTVVSYIAGILGPVIQSGASATGFAVTQRFKTVTGYYQFSPLSGDRLGLNFSMLKGGEFIAIGATMITASASTWTQFNVDFIYTTSGIPDTCILQILIDGPSVAGNDYHVGSSFLLDDLNLTGTATSVNDKSILPAKFSLEQNYPNPFNPSTKIQYNLPENSFVSLKIYNAIGKEVASLVNGVVPAGSHEILFDASGLNSGVYFYTLKAGNNFVQTRKMILMK